MKVVWSKDWEHYKIPGNKETKTLNVISEITVIRDKIRQKLRFVLLVQNTHGKKSNILGFIMPENRHPCSTLMDSACYYTLLSLVLEF